MEQVEPVGEIKAASLLPRIEVTLVSKLNLADFQNAVPLLREVSIVKDADFELRDVELQLTSVPAFFKSKVWRIDVVGASSRYALSDLDVQLDGALFMRLTEAEKATATFVLRTSGDDGVWALHRQFSVSLIRRLRLVVLIQIYFSTADMIMCCLK